MFFNKAKSQYFHSYFADWIAIYKKGAVRPVTFQKYQTTLHRLTELAPNLKICKLNKRSYQTLINEYAKTHEKQTTLDFHRHLKSSILDALDEGLLTSDPTRKVVIKGKASTRKKAKFLSKFELQSLLKVLTLSETSNWDWFILLVAKTGLRFSEALALCPNDFDFAEQKIIINKTWNYKNAVGGFMQTKNESSKRTLQIDLKLAGQFSKLVKDLPIDEPIFVRGRIFNSTVNNRLFSLCKTAGIPIISLHSLRTAIMLSSVSKPNIVRKNF